MGILCNLQVYNILSHNFLRLYSIYSYCKILAIFPVCTYILAANFIPNSLCLSVPFPYFCLLLPSLWAFQVAQTVKNLPAKWEAWGRSLGQEDPLEKGMAIHSSILAWRTPQTREARRAIVCGVAKSQT